MVGDPSNAGWEALPYNMLHINSCSIPWSALPPGTPARLRVGGYAELVHTYATSGGSIIHRAQVLSVSYAL
jgi:hypothetical protein